MRHLIFQALCILFYTLAHASPTTFQIANDIVIPGGLDRWLTNEFKLSKQYDDYTYAFSNEMYTPTSKKSEEIPYGDRNWDGYSYFEVTKRKPIVFGENKTYSFRIGAVGEASGAQALQQFIHDDLGMGQHPTWATQNPSEPALEYIYSHNTNQYVDSLVGITNVAQSYGFRVGNVVDEVFVKHQLTKNYFSKLFIYTGLEGKSVLYNTHLDGRLFQSNVYTVDSTWFVASTTAGVGIDIYGVRVSYEYKYTTEEFDGQNGRHTYGSLTFTF